ncbi:MAG: hypothetical protein WCR24_04880 [Candidatus Methanomethylophilaceae archaeon]
MKEQTSAEMAGGIAVGITGHVHGFNADAEARLDNMMMDVAEWIEKNAGMFLGHIKMSVAREDKGLTLNLVDIGTGVEHHNCLAPCVLADFNFMAAVLDVDQEELEHFILHAMEDSGVDLCIDDGHECGCGKNHEHDHEHMHKHDHEHCECGHHH